MQDIFEYLSKHLLVSIIIFLGIIFIFGKLFEKFLTKRLNRRFEFLKNRNNEICFIVFLSGALFLVFILLIRMKYSFPFIWLLGSSSLIIGGLLGLVPFSFLEEKPNARGKIITSLKQIDLMSMGIGALLLSIVAFLCGFFYVFRTNPKDIPIAIIMGIVFIPGGVLLGIFLGMIVSYIRKTKNPTNKTASKNSISSE